LRENIVHTNIWTVTREEEQEGTWEGNWMKKLLPEVRGKFPSSIFIYWGCVGINRKEYRGDLRMYLLRRSWSEIYLKPETRIIAIYN
jgi:hypothetical protein